MINPIENIPDWAMRIKRQDASFNKEILDRPCVLIPVSKEYESKIIDNHKSLKERWFDCEYQADKALEYIENTEFYGDALPCVFPNLGPEVFSAFCGCELEYGETTSWSVPFVEDWDEDLDKISFSSDNIYFKKIDEMTDVLLEKGEGKFYTGITDIHPGGDGVCAFRDPQEMNFDMIDNPQGIKNALGKLQPVLYKVFDYFYNKLKDKGQPCCTWHNTVLSKKFYIPSCDFSCMVSNKMFREFFLPGIVEECKFYENSIYHLDGPAALRHLDDILDIKELNIVQWVPGVGHDIFSDEFNLPILKKIQSRGKGIQFYISPWELDIIMDNLKPNGVHLSIYGVKSKDEANNLLKKTETWK